MLWFRIYFDTQSIEEIDRHLLLAPLLPRLCPGLLLVDTTLSAGLLALLSCWEMVWMQDVMQYCFVKHFQVVKFWSNLQALSQSCSFAIALPIIFVNSTSKPFQSYLQNVVS